MTYLPSGPRESNASDKRVVEPSNVDPKVVERHSLGTRLVSETLDGVQLLQRCVSSGEDEAEDEDEGDDGLCLSSVFDHGCSRSVDLRLAVRSVDNVGGNEGAHNAENTDADARGNEELRATTPFVGVDGAEDGTAEGDDVLHAVEQETAAVAGDTCALEHSRVVVGDLSLIHI